MAGGIVLDVTSRGLPELKRRLDADYLLATATDQMLRTIGRAGVEAASLASQPSDTGELAQSWNAMVEPLAVRVISLSPHARYLDEGRREGARMPPPQVLAGWAGRHNWQGSLFVLARAIGRRGIPPRHMLTAAFRAMVAARPAAIETAARTIEQRFRAR